MSEPTYQQHELDDPYFMKAKDDLEGMDWYDLFVVLWLTVVLVCVAVGVFKYYNSVIVMKFPPPQCPRVILDISNYNNISCLYVNGSTGEVRPNWELKSCRDWIASQGKTPLR